MGQSFYSHLYMPKEYFLFAVAGFTEAKIYLTVL